jgi:hypothetical protein
MNYDYPRFLSVENHSSSLVGLMLKHLIKLRVYKDCIFFGKYNVSTYVHAHMNPLLDKLT